MVDHDGAPPNKPFVLDGHTIAPGDRKTINIPLSLLADHTRLNLTAKVINGRKAGPTMFVSGVIHGDEIIGVEIIRRLATTKMISRLRGTLVLIPVVNTYGFVSQSRYLPDRRDLNRCFPGSANGSLAAQLAHIFMTKIVKHCQYGIDIHSGAQHRANLPQIRADLDDQTVRSMAEAFGASIMINSNLRDGSLRAEAQEIGCNLLLYEAGEALRFDEYGVRVGVRGVLNVLRHIGMLPEKKSTGPHFSPIYSESSFWIRSPMGGIMRPVKKLGDKVEEGEVMAYVSDPLGRVEQEVKSDGSGIVIGRTNLPNVNKGDALFHVANLADAAAAQAHVDAHEAHVTNDPIFTEPMIV